MRLIDADALLERIENPYQYREVARWVNDMPTIEPKKGKWIYSEDDYGIDGYHCDKCGFFVPWDYTHKFINYIDDYNYCPSCGADMREEQ